MHRLPTATSPALALVGGSVDVTASRRARSPPASTASGRTTSAIRPTRSTRRPTAVRAAARGRREHPDHADRRQPRRPDAHVHGSRERERRQRPRERAGRHPINFTTTPAPARFSAEHVHHAGGTGSCTVDLTSTTTGVTTVSAQHDRLGRRRLADPHDERRGRQLAPGRKTWVNAKISIAPTRRTRSATRTRSPSRCRRTPAPAVRRRGRRARRRHADRLERRGPYSTPPRARATTRARTPTRHGQCTIVFTSPTAGKVTGHASATLSVNGSPPFTVATDGTGRTRRRGEDVRRREHPDHAADGDEPGRPTHTFTAHVNVNTGTGGFANAPAGTVDHLHQGPGPGSLSAATVRHGRRHRQLHRRRSTRHDRGHDRRQRHTTVSVGGVVLTRNTNGTGANSAPATRRGSTRGSRSRRRDERGQRTRTRSPSRCRRTPAPALRRRPPASTSTSRSRTRTARRALERRPAPATTPGANTTRPASARSCSPRRRAGKVTGHATATLTIGGSAPFTVRPTARREQRQRRQDVRRREHPDHAERRRTGSATRTCSRRTST